MATTAVINITNPPRDLFLGYIAPHGKLLPANGTIIVEGDQRTVLAGGRNRYGRDTELTGMQRCIDSKEICLQEIPEPACSSSAMP